MTTSNRVLPIRPEVGIYAAFSRMNYHPWYALAEFVDNAVQSFRANRARLSELDGTGPLKVEVLLEGDCIRISDRAAGIAAEDLGRAFAPAKPPPDTTGLSEFGIGMKAAACWFADRWTVRTSALGEPIERRIEFDVPRIVSEGLEELTIDEVSAGRDDHFTVVELHSLRVRPRGATVAKIRNHLSSIYRSYLRAGDLEITFVAGDKSTMLGHHEPAILDAPHFKRPGGVAVRWRKDIDIDVGVGQRVWGWAGLLARASTSEAGFAVLRRGRVIEGSFENTWRPDYIFKRPNSYTYQRLTGELHVEGFDVSFSKDGIHWGDSEDEVLALLLERIDDDSLPLVRQAEGYRAQKKAREVNSAAAQQAVDTTARDIETHAPPVLASQIDIPPPDVVLLPEPPTPAVGPPMLAEVVATHSLALIPHGDCRIWNITISIVKDRAMDWYHLSPPVQSDGKGDVWSLEIRLNLDHPFSEQYINDDEGRLEPIVRIVAALSLAEITAREAGLRHAGRVRHNFNQLLRTALSRGPEASDV